MDKSNIEAIKDVAQILRSYGENILKLAELLQEIIDTSKEG